MNIALLAILVLTTIVIGFTAIAAVLIRKRNMHYWLGGHVIQKVSRKAKPAGDDQPVDVFIAVCDHFEPEWGRPGKKTAIDRVRRWRNEYPQLFGEFADVNGRPPQHTFFYPQDEYAPEYLDLLAELCGEGFGDVDVHLHHDNDTADGLRHKLEEFRQTLFHKHGLLRRDADGQIVYGFIHGNWALCNSRPDGRWCGVNDEINILRETGCYADFTMPSAPSDTQTRTINSIYYAVDKPGQTKSHDRGIAARVGAQPPGDSLLMIQGPLTLDWRRRKLGLVPRIENGDLHASNAPSASRLDLWLDANVHVQGKHEWKFVKLHTHGAKDGNIDMWLGDRARRFHQQLAARAAANPLFRYHYVTAWEMSQLVHRAEALTPPAASVAQSPPIALGGIPIVYSH